MNRQALIPQPHGEHSKQRIKVSRENGVFTDQGYLLYHGCSHEMQNILCQNLGITAKEIPEPQELKLYMPLKGSTYYDENQFGQFDQTEHEMELYPEDLAEYADEIEEAMSEYEINSSEERPAIKSQEENREKREEKKAAEKGSRDGEPENPGNAKEYPPLHPKDEWGQVGFW